MQVYQRHCAVSLRNTLYPLLNTGSIHEDMHPLDITETLLTET